MGLTEDTYERYQQRGELEPDTLRKFTADALTNVDPALQAPAVCAPGIGGNQAAPLEVGLFYQMNRHERLHQPAR